MRAVILAGGEGTRLRPLTLTLPKPVVPVVDRPLLRHQIDLLSTVGVADIIFSVAYRPEKVQAAFGDGSHLGKRITYAVEDTPLGTGGAVRNALPHLDSTTIVFNGDVLTDVDLPSVVAAHRLHGARATLVLVPVPNPSAYGLVESDPSGRVRRFVEKPSPSEVTTDTINAGIYVLETEAVSRMPAGVIHSIERSFFPALLAGGDLVHAYVHRGYWIDIGTPENYLQVHRDILRRRFRVELDGRAERGGWIDPGARVAEGVTLEGPFFVGPGCVVEPGARVGPDAVLVSEVHLEAGASVEDSVLWPRCRLGPGARAQGALLGLDVRLGRQALAGPRCVLGEGCVLPDFTRTG
jgi:NDP-sugar pyrophosphorylase family protein